MSKESPIYEGVKLTLKGRIDRGELAEGQQLPSEFELVNQFGVSRHQVRQALRELELDGYLERSQGRGSFVAPRAARSQGLRVTGPRTVAICFPQYSSLYARQIIDGFLRHMANRGLKTMAYNLQFDDHSEREFLQTVLDSGVSGLAIWLNHSDEPVRSLVSRLHESRFPIVLVDRYLPGVETDCVASDNEDIGYRLTRALLEGGHEQVAFATSERQDFTSVAERYEGFRRALREAGLDPDAGLLEIGYTPETQSRPIAAMLAQYRRPTAFLCVNDLVAHALSKHLAELGYTVGDNVELATVDDDHIADEGGIPILRVVQDAYGIGARAAEFLIERLQDPERPVQRQFFQAGPVIGAKSSAGAATLSTGKGGGKAKVASARLRTV